MLSKYTNQKIRRLSVFLKLLAVISGKCIETTDLKKTNKQKKAPEEISKAFIYRIKKRLFAFFSFLFLFFR
ncbi:hypothetical protein DDV96_09350 [Marixanthomonas spongiae]|uniref:Uncharacterized protein n=1 Tax=Marixanthomonas spongiae TaxID=2174845 RepID=A0A2U0I0T2_9FLAO|nr:hypothetical protein DDV96_09350 [Marixanthomonas spongiae]